MLGGLYSALLILSFPPVFLPIFALALPAPGLLATRLCAPAWKIALGFGLGSLPAWAVLHLWLIDVTAIGYPFLALILGAYGALFVWLARRAARAMPWWLAAPLAWAAVEFLKGSVLFHGYPWHLTGQPLVATPLWALLPMVGVYGAGLLVALGWGAGLGACVWRRVAAAALILAVLGTGAALRVDDSGAPVARVAVVQTSVPQDNKVGWTLEQRREDFEGFLRLSRLAAEDEPTLIVWPETMFPGIALDAASLGTLRGAGLAYPGGTPVTAFADELLAFQREIGTPILIGAHGYDGLRVVEDERGGVRFESGAEYNSAMLVEGGRAPEERYDKLHLTPFGEVMPYISWSDWLESRLLGIGAPGMAFNLSAGERATVFEVEGFRFATPICFEATMPGVCRRLAYGRVMGLGTRRVDALVQLTNDGWFGPWPGGRETHLLLARCRAAELGVPVVRAANTGISAVIDARGSVNARQAPQAWAVLRAEVVRGDRAGTVYGRFVGDAAGWVAMAVTFAGAALSYRRRKTDPEEEELDNA